MNKKKIQKEYKLKLELLNKHNKFYYDKNNPKISDSEYDDLKKNGE